ncbi:MAG: hypothetical protein JWQ37_3089 [Blastococcus sp.]|nr:hypothetical protein [Blastococcus sp.]
MRIVAISDVHGNLIALDAVLADIATQSVDVVVVRRVRGALPRP